MPTQDSAAYLLPKDEQLGKSDRFHGSLVLAKSRGQWNEASESQPLPAKAFRPNAHPCGWYSRVFCPALWMKPEQLCSPIPQH